MANPRYEVTGENWWEVQIYVGNNCKRGQQDEAGAAGQPRDRRAPAVTLISRRTSTQTSSSYTGSAGVRVCEFMALS